MSEDSYITNTVVEILKELDLALDSIGTTQNFRSYKSFLIRRRLKQQLIYGSPAERKKFIKWALAKILKGIHKDDDGIDALITFDLLESAKKALVQAQSSICTVSHIAENQCAIRKDDRLDSRGPQIFMFAGVHYCDVGGGQRSAQMTRVFNRLGYRVYYIYYCVHPIYKDGADNPLMNAKAPSPMALHCHISGFSIQALDILVEDDPLFIFEVPTPEFEPYLDYAEAHHIPAVYEHIDNWDSTLCGWEQDKSLFIKYLKKPTLVTVTSRLLGRQLEEALPTVEYLYLPNAVDTEIFDASKEYEMPNDLVKGNRTLLYFGSLWGVWFDWDKIYYLSRNCDCEINLVGSYEVIPDKVRNSPENIHFLGEKPCAELPAYLAHSDIALLPFLNDNIGKYVSPVKIFEYIAMGKPVLSTPLDDIAGYPNVFVSDDSKEWAKIVQDDIPVINAADTFTSANSWHARCTEILHQTKKGAQNGTTG